MSFLNDLEILTEKLDQAEFVAYGYKWGREARLAVIVHHLRQAIAIQENLIKEIIDHTSFDSKTNEGDRS